MPASAAIVTDVFTGVVAPLDEVLDQLGVDD